MNLLFLSKITGNSLYVKFDKNDIDRLEEH